MGPPELFEATFERARALGFRTTAHAGEAAGAASVWGAVRALGVDRIGHATRAVEDPELESAQRAHHFTRDEIRRLMLSSIEATWLSADRKKRLAADFERDPSWNSDEG
jgi:adenosine deaminase